MEGNSSLRYNFLLRTYSACIVLFAEWNHAHQISRVYVLSTFHRLFLSSFFSRLASFFPISERTMAINWLLHLVGNYFLDAYSRTNSQLCVGFVCKYVSGEKWVIYPKMPLNCNYSRLDIAYRCEMDLVLVKMDLLQEYLCFHSPMEYNRFTSSKLNWLNRRQSTNEQSLKQ